MLWHYTAEYYPAGDIGLASDDDIAEALYWDKDPGQLIEALKEHGWLDSTGGRQRLIVHDWPHHAEDAVHLRLARQQKYFADGSAPKFVRLSGSEKKKAEDFYGPTTAHEKRTESAREAHAERTESASCAPEGPRLGHGVAGHGFSEEANNTEFSNFFEPLEADAPPDILAICKETEAVYVSFGVPTPPKHKKLVIQNMQSYPDPSHLPRLPKYVRWCFESGKWSSASKSKGFANLMRDGDWDVEIDAKPAARRDWTDDLETPEEREARLSGKK
jgi:hypothetical protein